MTRIMPNMGDTEVNELEPGGAFTKCREKLPWGLYARV